MNIDLHLHTSISDGTDSPGMLLEKLRKTDIDIFSITDHDDCRGCEIADTLKKPGDPTLIPGIEINARTADHQKFHILGYAYDSSHPAIKALLAKVHQIRIDKAVGRINFLEQTYGFRFSETDKMQLLQLPNPGKPHLGNLMVTYGYAESMPEAIRRYINNYHETEDFVTPTKAIQTILASGGIPVLAHGIFGDGGQLLSDEDLEKRVRLLLDDGLQGLECWYSRYTEEQQQTTFALCRKYHLLATAGSDYHGTNKPVRIGETHLTDALKEAELMRFLQTALPDHRL